MGAGKFSIDLKQMYWINGNPDDPYDLCLHGDVTAVIDDEYLECSATVSAAALYLLRSLTEDHVVDTSGHLLPCCGNSMFADIETTGTVHILGCCYGMDWSVIHSNEEVELSTKCGKRAKISLFEYVEIVLQFVDKVEKFYQSCSPKCLPDDEFSKAGYNAFWNEWNWRKDSVVLKSKSSSVKL